MPKPRLNSKELLANLVYSKYRNKAQQKGIPWGLTKREVFDIIYKRCYYCGARGTNKYACFKEARLKYNGIDRVSSRRGYTPKNVVTCCGTCNYAKRKMSISQLKAWLKRIYKHFIEEE